MAMSDPIADILTRIRNACRAKHRFVDLPLSKMHLAIVGVLKDEGFIDNFLQSEEKGKIRVFLKFTKDRRSVINNLERISKPGVRKYIGVSQIPSVRKGLGFAILTTPKGVLTGEAARKAGVGGEIICKIW